MVVFLIFDHIIIEVNGLVTGEILYDRLAWMRSELNDEVSLTPRKSDEGSRK